VPYTIGLTGGIASGKSTVARAFERRGIAVIDADLIARELTARGQPLLEEVVRLLGPQARRGDGELDRPWVRSRVFADHSLRRRLEELLHPAIRARLAAQAAAAPGPYVVVAIPLLVEGGVRDGIDRILVVDCPEELQLARLMARDGEPAARAEAMLAAQATRAQRRAAADDVIANDGGIDALDRAVGALHQRYLAFAAGRR
jgi:dephospho-CoA kinase